MGRHFLYSASPLGGAASGLRTFNYGLAPALASALTARGHALTMLCSRPAVEDFRRRGVRAIEAPGEGVLFENSWLPAAIRRIKPDAVFFPSSRVPFMPFGRVPVVLTVHDLLFWRYPSEMRLTTRWFRSVATRFALRSTAAAVADSGFTKDELASYGCRCPVHVAHLGYDRPNGARTIPAVPSVLGASLGDRRFFLFLGTQTFQKNLPALVRAFGLFCRREGAVDLVIAGSEGTGTAGLKVALAELDGTALSRTAVLGRVSEEDREALYSKAFCFVFPSFYEGFGLPLLEAFSHGVPVIHSTAGALQEVAGGAGLPAEPNEHALCDAMLRVHRDPALRRSLIDAGFERLRSFSWGKTAMRICAVLEGVCGGGGEIP